MLATAAQQPQAGPPLSHSKLQDSAIVGQNTMNNLLGTINLESYDAEGIALSAGVSGEQKRSFESPGGAVMKENVAVPETMLKNTN
jgi:hypothetical protein